MKVLAIGAHKGSILYKIFPEMIHDMEAKTNNWILSGAGMEGESYISDSNPEVLLKVFTAVRSKSFVEDEFNRSRELLDCGIPTPKVLEYTEYNGFPAIVYQRINNKKSFCKLAGEKPEMIPYLAKQMAEMTKDLHSKPAVSHSFPSKLEQYRKIIGENTCFDHKQKELMLEAIERISKHDTHTILHGDLHFGNIITDGKNPYFIDFGDASYGNPCNDLAMFYITTHYGSEHSFDLLYHLNWGQAMEFWNIFKIHYFGRDIPDEEILCELRDYMLARVTWFKHEQIQKALFSIFGQENCPVTSEVKLKMLGE